MTQFDKEFIEEITRNHGTDSIQYVWAMATVRENIAKRERAARKAGK